MTCPSCKSTRTLKVRDETITFTNGKMVVTKLGWVNHCYTCGINFPIEEAPEIDEDAIAERNREYQERIEARHDLYHSLEGT